jgi:hypothetical protein
LHSTVGTRSNHSSKERANEHHNRSHQQSFATAIAK